MHTRKIAAWWPQDRGAATSKWVSGAGEPHGGLARQLINQIEAEGVSETQVRDVRFEGRIAALRFPYSGREILKEGGLCIATHCVIA